MGRRLLLALTLTVAACGGPEAEGRPEIQRVCDQWWNGTPLAELDGSVDERLADAQASGDADGFDRWCRVLALNPD